MDSTDLPVPFGYKMSWIAVRSTDARRVAELLDLKHVEACSWRDGIRKAYNHEGVFVCPAIDGWILAPGSHRSAEQPKFQAYLKSLSKRIGQIFYFGTHRIVGYQAWARAENGKILRAFAYFGERGEYLLNIGERTPEEIAIDTGVAIDPVNDDDWDKVPKEETVLTLASKWVIDPRKLNQQAEGVGPGLFGKV